MARRRTATVIVLFLTAVLAAVLLPGGLSPSADAARTPHAAATFPGANDRIAYVKVASGGSDIFSVRPNGTGNKRLTQSLDAWHPLWSASGKRIAYERPGEVWVMGANGGDQKKVADGDLVGWMPTGGRVLVVEGLGVTGIDPTWSLVTVSTGAVEDLPIDLPLVAGLGKPPYPDYSEWSYAANPTLSSDGELIALTLRREDYGDDGYSWDFGSFFTVRLDGTDLTRVGKYTYSFGGLAWSPDNDEIAYWASEPRAYCATGLRSLELTGYSGSVSVNRPCSVIDPAWSPNGRKIVYGDDGGGKLRTSNPDGTHVTTVLDHKYGVTRFDPDWRRAP
ncbi:hypothetical protein F0U44_08265 [Nocardioides humilatus]|uniref:WD40 repeat protein n=1 Tax=Nocardioides humilatus TaxID=2607660 RepID=A0A5B1LFS5_9ACTN|nr:PD40 domain-containing protein [Nocardioides humilatus]KAA1418497.1 hypothetical protein F0U44_08265 [Nocardioides humilatus]